MVLQHFLRPYPFEHSSEYNSSPLTKDSLGSGYCPGERVILQKYLGNNSFKFYRTTIVTSKGRVEHICEGETGSVIGINGPDEIIVSTKEGGKRTIPSHFISSPLETIRLKSRGEYIESLSDSTSL